MKRRKFIKSTIVLATLTVIPGIRYIFLQKKKNINIPEGISEFDFEDIKDVIKENSIIKTGSVTASGENRAKIAVRLALNSLLSDNVNINNANTLLVNIITDKKEATYNEIAYITKYLARSGDNVDLIWKTGKNEGLEDKISVNIFAI